MKKEYTARDHTFVVCAYKENPFLEELIHSLCEQTTPGEIICATSTPNEHIKKVCNRFGLPLVVNDGNASIARDWNYGYNQAETPLITIAHQDDLYEPNYVERVVAEINAAHREIGVVHTDYYEIRKEGRVENNGLLAVKRRMNRAFTKKMLAGSARAKRRALSFGNFICCPSVTFNKNVVGSSVFDVEYDNSCDWRTWLSLAERGVSFLYVPSILMGHRIYAGSTTTQNIENDVRSIEDLEIMESLWPRPIARALFSFYSSGEKSNAN